MNISPIKVQVSFSAGMNDGTREIIRKLSKNNPQQADFEQRFDEAIENSVLKDFGDDNTTVSVGIYRASDGWESMNHAAAVVNSEINGKKLSVALPSDGHAYYGKHEEGIIGKLMDSSEPFYAERFIRGINRISARELKTLFAKEYIRQCSSELLKNANSETYDKFMSGEISFPEVNA